MSLSSNVYCISPTVERNSSLPHMTNVIFTVTHYLPHKHWRVFGEKLGISSEGMQFLLQAKSQDNFVLKNVLHAWLSGIDEIKALQTLEKVLIDMNLHNIADLVTLAQYEDSNSRWLK